MADPETTSWMAAVLGLLGLGSGGGLFGLHVKSSNHGARIDRLERDREKDSKAIQATHTTVTTLDERTSTMLGLLQGKD